MHGFPSSRLEFAPNHLAAWRAGLRVLSPDRPAVGLSDPAPDPTPEGWAADVAELADALGVDRFTVLTWSAGGPYAAACASTLAARVTAFAVVAGMPPRLAGTAPRRGEPLRPWRDLAVAWVMRRVGRAAPGRLVALIERTLPACDREIMARPAIRQNETRNLREAFRQPGCRSLREILLRARRLGIERVPPEIPAAIWAGALDRNVPVTNAPRWGEVMPHATANVLPRAGHLIFYSHADDVLTWIAL